MQETGLCFSLQPGLANTLPASRLRAKRFRIGARAAATGRLVSDPAVGDTIRLFRVRLAATKAEIIRARITDWPLTHVVCNCEDCRKRPISQQPRL